MSIQERNGYETSASLRPSNSILNEVVMDAYQYGRLLDYHIFSTVVDESVHTIVEAVEDGS